MDLTLREVLQIELEPIWCPVNKSYATRCITITTKKGVCSITLFSARADTDEVDQEAILKTLQVAV